VDYDIEIGAAQKRLFGGEGLFYATLRGPEPLISIIASALADRIIASAPRASGTAEMKEVYWAVDCKLLNGDRRF
jgi:hypothetical protein